MRSRASLFTLLFLFLRPADGFQSIHLPRPPPPIQRHRPPLLITNPVKPAPFFSTQSYLSQTQQGKETFASKLIASGLPRWVTLIDEMLFVFASLIFVYGSFEFYPTVAFPQYVQGCQLFIVGSLIYLGLAIFAAYEIIEDARLANKSPDPFLLAEQFLYVFGSLLFTIGTYKFTPPLDKSPPLVQAVNDAAANIDAAAGTTLDVRWFGRLYEVFVAAGSAPPEVDEATLQLGDQLFAVGSVFYAIAAFVSALRAAGVNEGGNANDESEILLRRTAIATASLYELGGVAFVVGTLGFVPAGTLGIAGCPDGTRRMETFGASIFVLGSVFYTLGSSLTLAVISYLTYKEEDPATALRKQQQLALENEKDLFGAVAAEEDLSSRVEPAEYLFGTPVGLATPKEEEEESEGEE